MKKINALAAAVFLVASLAGTAQAAPAQETAAAATGPIINERDGSSISIPVPAPYPYKVALSLYKDTSSLPPESTRWRYDPATKLIINDATDYVIDIVNSPQLERPVLAAVPNKYSKTLPQWKWDAAQRTIANVATGHLLCSGRASTSDPNRAPLDARKPASVSPECRWKTDIFN